MVKPIPCPSCRSDYGHSPTCPTQWPLLEGGQGRTTQSIRDGASVTCVLIVILLVLLATLAITGLYFNPRS